MQDSLFGSLGKFVDFCIERRKLVMWLISLITLVFTIFAAQITIKTELDDLAPRTHPYVKIHESFKQTFGGANVVTMVVEVSEGDIFNLDTLKVIQKLTQDLSLVDSVNALQITSLASKKLKEIKSSTDGINTESLMWPNLPNDDKAVEKLKESVITNPLVYGSYVSRDLKSAMITVDFYDHTINYENVFDQISDLAKNATGSNTSVRVVGTPILFGWVAHYLPQTIAIFVITVTFLILLLLISMRTWRGTVLPLAAGVVSSIWALGFASMCGYNVDPLVIVVAFLITARSISHSVQLVTRFDEEIEGGADSKNAAKAAMLALFKPGMLGVIADAGCMIVVLLTPITLMQKVAVIGTVWVMTIAVSAVVLTPVLLSWNRNPKGFAHRIDISPINNMIIGAAVWVVTTRARYAILAWTLFVFIVSSVLSFGLTVGDANPGSPILWKDSQYNRDAKRINEIFPGADRMFVVFSGKGQDSVKDPATQKNLNEFQRFMEAQPEIGGSVSIADAVPYVKRVLHEDNPRYQEPGLDSVENGELINIMGNSAEPGDMDRYLDSKSQFASVTLFFRDLKGESIRNVITRIKEFSSTHQIETGEFLLAGGIAGILAATNEVLLSGQIESIAFALLVLVICCAVAYRSMAAGIFFMIPVVLSNTITFSFMAVNGIGMNINTIPVAALGIGLGVDYAFYIVDAIREDLHYHGHNDLATAIRRALGGAGQGVLITAAALIVSVALWSMSSLRFQAEMALLMGIWLCISSFSALFIVPSMVYVFKPKFIVERSI